MLADAPAGFLPHGDAGYWRAEAERWRARAQLQEGRHAALAAQNVTLAAQNVTLAGTVAAMTGQVAVLRERVDALTAQVATYARMLFGDRSEKAEKKKPDPDPGPDPDAGGGGGGRRGRGQRRGSRGHGRRDYAHLETEEVIHDVAAEELFCPCCAKPYAAFGEEIFALIGWVVKIVRVVHRRRRYRRTCRCPRARGVITAPRVAKAIGKGMFTTAFMARLLVEKFVPGRPLHKVVAALALEGAELSEGTLTGTLQQLSELLAPLAEAICARNAAAAHAHADETSWRVFEHVEGKDTCRWWLWVFAASDTVAYRIDKYRDTAVLEAHFGISRADGQLDAGRDPLLISCDFYSAYQSLAKVTGVETVLCWAHIRRYFVRAGDAHPGQLRCWADAWVARIGALYAAHRALAEAEPGSTAHTQAARALRDALAGIDATRKYQATGRGLHAAARKVLATLNREWDGLARHLDFPDLPLDNNTAERALRGPVVGRKNYYGSGAVWAAELAARVWTITGTARLAGLNPLTYLHDYPHACAVAGARPPAGGAFDRLLPWNTTQPPATPSPGRPP